MELPREHISDANDGPKAYWRAVRTSTLAEADAQIRAEGANLRALPLGTLPWVTKLGLCGTSLALVVRGR